MPQSERTPQYRLDLFKQLQDLRRSGDLGAAAFLAFSYLWDELGGRPGRIKLTAGLLAAEFGRDPRSARDWLNTLIGRGYVDVIDYDERRGIYDLYVNDPNEAIRPVKPDPQRRLPGCDPDDEGPGESVQKPPPILSMAGESAQKPPPSASVAGEIAQKPPGDLQGSPNGTGEPKEGGEHSHRARERGGEPESDRPPPATSDTSVLEAQASNQSTSVQSGTSGTNGSCDLPPIGDALAEALIAFTDATTPAEQARKLAAEVLWVAPDVEKIVLSAVTIGVETGAIHPPDVLRIVEEMKRKQTLSGLTPPKARPIEKPGAFLRAKLRHVRGYVDPKRRDAFPDGEEHQLE